MTTINPSNEPTALLNTVLLGQGVGTASIYSTATYPPTTTINQLLYSSAANTITGLTTAASSVLITSAGGVPSLSTTLPNINIGTPTAGVLTNCTGLPLTTGVIGILPSANGGTGINNGANTITLGGNISTAGALTLVGAFAATFNFTGATNVTFPTAGTLATTAGASGIVNPGLINQVAYYAAAGSAVSGLATANNGLLVTSNTGVPSILAGPGTTGQVLQANAAAAPSFSTASYPSTTTINQVLYSSAANTVTGLATVNSAALHTTSAGVPTWLGPLTNGQVVIGSTGATPVAATLTQGANITITNGAGTITIAAAATTSTGMYSGQNSGQAIAGGQTLFVSFSTASATENVCKFIVSKACTINNLYVQTDSTPGAAHTYTWTLRLNGVDQAVTCQQGAGATTANDTAHSFAANAGDVISVKLVTSASATTITYAYWSFATS